MNTDNFNRKIADTIDEKSNHEENEAAQVLTNLGISSAPEDKVDEEEDDFEIPQRYTKSGRKRAVSFPLKVCLLCFVTLSFHQ